MRVDIDGNPFGYRPASAVSPSTGTRRFHGSLWSEIGSRIELASTAVGHCLEDSHGLTRVICIGVQRTIQLVRFGYRTALLATVITGYDVVVLTGGSFFRGRDLPLLHRLGKRIVVIFTGSDHRPPFLNGKYQTSSSDEIVAETKRIYRFVGLAERYATAIVAASSSAQFHRRPFVHFLALGIPFAPSETKPLGGTVFTGTGLRILHCPTHLTGKGTDTVRAIIEGLRREGLAIDYVEMVDRPNHEVLAALAECDFAIDELLSDSPLARFATEAAWFGKPALSAGEYAREIVHDLPASLIPPSTFVPPEQVGDVIQRFATDADYRIGQGRNVQDFVRDQWNPRAVASRFLEILDGAAPSEWIYDPARLTYIGGWGLGPREWRRSVGAALENAGVESLGLSEALIARILARLGEEPLDDAARSET